MALDTRTLNKVTRWATFGNREYCETDEQRWMYDLIAAEVAEAKEDGLAFDTIHDTD